MKILLIENERPVAKGIIRLLGDAGYLVDWARMGTDGLTAAKSGEYDLVILDSLLPGMSGWDVCANLRKSQVNIQVLFLSSMNEPQDVAKGLNLGADDYMCKPFDPSELLARVRARLRTGCAHLEKCIRVGDLSVDRVEHKVEVSGRRLSLTRTEYAVLEKLATDAGKPVAHSVLAREADFAPDPLADPLDYCLGSLKRKFESLMASPLIHRAPGGYVLEARAI